MSLVLKAAIALGDASLLIVAGACFALMVYMLGA